MPAAPARARGAACRRSATSPSPISTSAQWASGARSPLAPSEPCSGTTRGDPGVEQREQRLGHAPGGRRSSPSRACARAAASSPAPPRARPAGPCRRRASARARAGAPRGARPGSRRWRASRSRSRRRRPARRGRRGRPTTAALASIARRASGAERTGAPSRATATTSSGESPVPVSSITPPHTIGMLRRSTVIALDGRSLTPGRRRGDRARRAQAADRAAARERNAAAERLVRSCSSAASCSTA